MSNIEWTDETWNPIAGCSIVSPGCHNCYAMTMAKRLEAMGQAKYKGLTKNGRWTGKINLSEKDLGIPLGWKKPRRVFVNSMSDLFHEDVPDEFIDKVFAVMALAGTHTFQILTKRAERMASYTAGLGKSFARLKASCTVGWSMEFQGIPLVAWPLPNVWLGVSVEDQKRADQRIPHLLKTPAAVRFISAEPLLGPVNIAEFLPHYPKGRCRHVKLGWVIVGGESGPSSRPMDVEWVREIIDQCKSGGVACFVKQLGAQPWDHNAMNSGFKSFCKSELFGGIGFKPLLKDKKGGDMSEWPEELRVRQFPVRTPEWQKEFEVHDE